MPYTIQKNDSGEHCVHKKNADGSIGKKIACHDSEDGAIAQIGAIESEEKKPKKKKPKKSFDGLHIHDPDLNFKIKVARDAQTSTYTITTGNTANDTYPITDNGVIKTGGLEDDMLENDTEPTIEEPIVEEPVTEEPIVEEPVTEEPSDDTPDVDPLYAVKALGEKRIGGYGIIWGSANEKDLDGEYFTQDTQDLKAIFTAMGKIPLVVHHAADDKVKTFVYGEVDVMEEDDTGLWWEGKIKEFEVYRKYVLPLLQRRAMFSSTGTLPAAKRRTKSGQITRWPVAEMTTTWTPAEWRMLERPVAEIKAAYKAIDINCDLSEYDDEQETDTKGAEKARLKAIVQFHISELELFELTLEEN